MERLRLQEDQQNSFQTEEQANAALSVGRRGSVWLQSDEAGVEGTKQGREGARRAMI